MDREKEMTEADERRRKIRERIDGNLRNDEKETQYHARVQNREDKKKIEEEEKIKKIREIGEKKKEEDILLKKAEKLLSNGRALIKNNEFTRAKDVYREAIDIFKSVGWFDQVAILYDERKKIEHYKIEYLKKKRVESLAKKKSREQFQARIDNLIKEKKEEEQENIARLKKIPPEIEEQINKIKLLIEKATKEEKINKINNALSRWKYVLELCNSIPENTIMDIPEIKKKIFELEAKKNRDVIF
ncbi:MAG: hypothetical protein ACTSRI_01200 [Promethearchaeota archaeon]